MEREEAMTKKKAVLLLGLVTILVSGWWVLRGGSLAQPQEGVLDIWTTWAGGADQLQALFDRYTQATGKPVAVTAGVDGRQVSKALSGSSPPDVVVLSTTDPVGFYHAQGLLEPLAPWIEATHIELEDVYPAPLAPCATGDGDYVCLPWSCDAYALFWNKDLFDAAGLDPERPPRTMEELAEYADRLTVRDESGKITRIGFLPDFPRSNTDLYVRMVGGAWYSDDGTKLSANTQPVIDALTWQRQFFDAQGSEDVQSFVESLSYYTNSRHALYAGRRLSCQECHRGAPASEGKLPANGFYDGRVAMMISGQWQVGPHHIPRLRPDLDYGVAPFPPPSAHPERVNTTVVRGPVTVIPAGVKDKQAAADLLAWMMSPEVVADVAHANASLPTSRTAARDSRFRQIPQFDVFLDLLADPNAASLTPSPISTELNEALGALEKELFHESGGDPAALLNAVQTEFSIALKERKVR
jgi:multiple sugar transport system substrate-binding protein